MKTKWTYLLIFLPLLTWQCSKDSGFDCIKSTGRIVRETRSPGPFHKLEVHNNINLYLLYDPLENSIEVEAGENLLPGILTQADNGNLVIQNENKCNWVRNFETPINVYLTYSDLDTIIYRAAGDLTCLNPWKRDTVQFDVWEGAGIIDLNLDAYKSYIYYHYGTVDINVRGISEVSIISNRGYGPINTLDLMSKFTYVGTMSPNDCFVYASIELGVTIENIGNVYYAGNPGTINQDITGSGKLFPWP